MPSLVTLFFIVQCHQVRGFAASVGVRKPNSVDRRLGPGGAGEGQAGK